jgi:hypothetical protein
LPKEKKKLRERESSGQICGVERNKRDGIYVGALNK